MDSAVIPTQGTLNILTYNIHGLPSEITGDDTPVRLAQIGSRLEDFDLIGLQEDWIVENHDLYIATTPFSSQDYFDEHLSDEKLYGSGLTLLSNFKYNSIQHFHYSQCFGYTSNASDCFASKGLQLVEISLDGDSTSEQTLHMYNTHLEAGSGIEDQEIRQEQIAQIIDTINTQSVHHPVILMGDFNLSFADEADALLLNHLMNATNLRQSCLELNCDEPDHIDQIFLRDGSNIALSIQEWHNQSSNFLDAQSIDLSDHPPISIQLIWNNTLAD